MRRPNKLAEGMTKTLERQRKCGTFRGYKTIDTPRLAVFGSLDSLNTTMPFIAKQRCTHCNGTGRVGIALTDRGKQKLQRLRKKK